MTKYKILTIIALVWLLLALVVYALGYVVFDQARVERLASKGVEIYANVDAKEPQNHNTIRYSYSVKGKDYKGSGGAGNGNPALSQIQIGQKLVAYYDPTRPEDSFLGYPQLRAESQNGLILLMVLIVPAVPMLAVLVFYFVLGRQRRPN